MTIRHFLDKSRGKKTNIEDFPFLFSLQIHTGVSGIVFSAAWFIIVGLSYRDFWNIYTAGFAIIIIIGFLAMVIFGTVFTQKIIDRSFDDQRTADDWDFYARASMMSLVILFAAACSALIWFTGGMSSPFIPFYVMVYTLTLTRCALPHPGQTLMLFYALTFAGAGFLAEKVLPPHVDAAIITSINHGKEREVTEFTFALAAMVVPYLSTLYAESRDARRKKRAGIGTPEPPTAPMPSSPQPPGGHSTTG